MYNVYEYDNNKTLIETFPKKVICKKNGCLATINVIPSDLVILVNCLGHLTFFDGFTSIGLGPFNFLTFPLSYLLKK